MNSLNIATEVSPSFSVSTFAPGWGSVVMGTGVLAVVPFSLANAGILPGPMRSLSIVFMWITVLVAVPILGITAARWFTAPRAVHADLNHPVKGAMSATFPGGILALAIAMGRSGQLAFGPGPALVMTAILSLVGAALALYVGFVFLTRFLSGGDTPKPLQTGAWFIPPVVTILVPIALVPFLTSGSSLSKELLWGSWTLLGFGTFLFIVIATILTYRGLTAPPPPARLAPTLVIGMGPAALIGLNIISLSEASLIVVGAPPAVLYVATPLSVMFWGFGLWWLIMAVIVMFRAYTGIPFALSWWAFTFPVGAWVVTGAKLFGATSSEFIAAASVFFAVALLMIWAVTFIKTLKGVVNRSIWQD